jgi:hypothetical protein
VSANDIVLWIVVAVVAFLAGQSRDKLALPFGANVNDDGRLVAYRRWLSRFIERSYGIDEINVIAFDIGINCEQISGDTIGERAREFVIHCERGGMIPQMLDALKLRRG